MHSYHTSTSTDYTTARSQILIIFHVVLWRHAQSNVTLSEEAFLSRITERQSMHCGHRGKGDRNYESSSRGKWGFLASSSSCGTAAAAAFPPSCTHQSGAQLGGDQRAELNLKSQRHRASEGGKKQDCGETLTSCCSDVGAGVAAAVAAAAAPAASGAGAGAAPAVGGHEGEAPNPIGYAVVRTPVCREEAGAEKFAGEPMESARDACR